MPSLYTETPSFIDYLQIKYKVSPTTKSIWKNTRKYKQRCIIQVKRFPNLNGNTIFEFHIHACNWFQRKQLVKDLNVQLSLKICIPRYIMAAIKGTKLLNYFEKHNNCKRHIKEILKVSQQRLLSSHLWF